MSRMSWADAVIRNIEERGELIRNMAKMFDEDRDFINKHLDFAFEGRLDYLRMDAPPWVWNRHDEIPPIRTEKVLK